MADIRYQLLVATTAEWESKNPILRKGEPGLEVTYTGNKITTSRMKIGDGVSTWTELPYNTDDYYPYNDLATISIGDIVAGEDLQGQLLSDLLKKFLAQYINPQITSFKATNKTSYTYEVGTDLPANYTLSWIISNIENIQDLTTGIISSSDVNAFTNLGNVNLNDLNYILNCAGSYSYSLPQNINITLTGYNDKNQQINTAEVDIDWKGLIAYGVNGTGEVSTSTHFNTIKNQNNLLSNSAKRTYSFSVGYPFILIPDFIDISNVSFKDADNGLDFSMDYQDNWNGSLPRTVTINNGNINVTYNILRGEFYYNAPTSIIIE